MPLEFRLLGEFTVLADGRRLDLGGPRQRSVLALLLLQRDRAIATASLADKVWPDDQPLSAIKTVQIYVSRLRDVLGPEAGRLSSTSSGYRLAVADDEFDVARFERGLREAREASASGDQDRARATLQAALAEWSGPALGDMADERFALSEADRLEELRMQAIEELYQARIDMGAGRDGIAELRGLVADEPGRETLWRLLMLALYGDGRQAEALEVYQDARRYLADELGLDPSPELQGLERAILNQEALVPAREREPAPPAAKEARAEVPPTSPTGAESPAQRRRRVVTVLRADPVRTADATDPEILEALGRRAENIVRRAIERHGGIIEHTDQTGVTAVFGLAVAREDDALRAVRAAAELRGDAGSDAAVARLVLSVGVATGEVLAGPGSGHGELVTGEPLHVAGGLAERAAGDEILLAIETERLVRGSTTTEPVSLDGGDDEPAPGVVRLVAVSEGEPIERRTTTPFVGRAADLDALAAAFERVATDAAPGLVTVTGVPGVGKSRLVAEALGSIAGRATVLRSRCLPYGEGITYWPVRELVQAATGIEHGEPREDALTKLDAIVGGEDRADLVRGSVASVMGLTEEPVPGEEIAWAVRRFLELLAARRPLVLVVDDLQWAEPALIDLLDHVLDLGRGPVLLVAIGRPELEDVRPDWLARPSLALMRLDALVDTDTATLLDHLAPELPPGDLRSRILASAEGNPLFVEQFVAYVTDEALAGRATLDATTAADVPVPPTIGALLAARLDRVPEAERRVLERASVIGRTFWTGALTELLADDERSDVARRLARLARRDLIRPQPSDFADEDAYRFRHLLIRDAAYASLPKRDRSELHERFADWLERSSRQERDIEVEEILGYHLEQAYRYRHELGPLDEAAAALGDRASTRLASAGRRALARGDFPAAAKLLERAARLLDEAQIDRHLLLSSAGEAYMEIGEFGIADALLVEAAAGARSSGDEPVSIAADLIRLQLHVRSEASTSIDEVMDQAELAIADLAVSEDPRALARAWRLLELANGVSGRYKPAGDANALALDYARRAGDRVLEKRLYSSAAQVALSGPSPAPDGIVHCEELLRMAEGDRRAQGVTLAALAHLRAMVGDLERAREDYRRGRANLEELGLRFDAALISIDSGAVELLADDAAAAEAELRKDYEALDAMGERNYISSIAGLLAEALYRQGRIAEAAEQAAFCEAVAAPSDVFSQHLWRGVRGKLLAREGAHDQGVQLAASGVDQTRTSDDIEGQGNALMFLAEAQAAAGRHDDAARSAAEARVLFDAKGNVVSAARAAAFSSPFQPRSA